MRAVCFPEGFRLERLSRLHRRSRFTSGDLEVDSWLHTKAPQNQEKHLSVTTVLLDGVHEIAATLSVTSTGPEDF